MKKNFCFTLKPAIMILLLGSAIPAMAMDTTGRFRLGGQFFAGGSEGTNVGKTTDGREVHLSGAGQVGLSLRVGYGLSPTFDIDIAGGEQGSELLPIVNDAGGTFHSKFVVATLKYKIPVSDKSQLKIGGGLGYYYSGKMELDTSRLSGGYNTDIKYKGAVGKYLTCEYEFFYANDWSFVGGLIYYNVKYEADSATWNDANIPVSDLPDKLRTLDGNGADFLIWIEKYF